MKKSTLLRMAFTLCGVVFLSSAFAQLNLTIKNADGTDAAGAVVYTMLSGTGAPTDLATANGTGFATWTPAAGNYNLLIRNAAGTAWNAYSFTYAGVAINATVTLRPEFNPTIRDYAANRTNDTITINKAMPFWVYPSPVHNPKWTTPAANYLSAAKIAQNTGAVDTLLSTFGWTATGLAPASTSNYVELTFATAGPKTISVLETPAAAYGGCAGTAVNFFVRAINPPYVTISNPISNAPGYYIGAAGDINVIANGCDPVSVDLGLAASNTDEKYPYYLRMKYFAYNATVSGAADIDTLTPRVTIPTGLTAFGTIAPADTVSGTNPLILDGTVGKAFPYSVLNGAKNFVAINNKITVYVLDLESNGWNAKISRKSDYLAFRNAEAGGTVTDKTKWNDSRYSWYNGKVAPADITKAYIIVFPKPVTGPIYHIPNSFGL